MKATKISKKAYTRHSVEYKTEALKLAERVGVPEAARQLDLHESQLYQWRNQQQHQQSVSQREQEQATEIARLRREFAVAHEGVAILKNADLVCDALQMAIFKRKRPKGVIVHSDRGS